MRSKLVLAGLIFLSTLTAVAQVAPAAKISGIPLGIGGGIADYDTDYYQPNLPYWSGRMIGASAWIDYKIFRGLGVEVEGTSIFANKPTFATYPVAGLTLYGTGLKENTVKGGFIYKFREIHKVRPFVKALGGEGKIDFETQNPGYTYEDSPLWAAGGGIEYRVWKQLCIRGEYEYQSWKGFRNDTKLDPSGLNIGATYYLRGIHRHS